MKRRLSREPYGSETSVTRTHLVADFSTVDNALRTGRGYMVYPNGTIYEGEWKQGERDGLGVCYYESGNIYVGRFVGGKMEGEGTMFFASGDLFTGDFKDSQIHRGVFIAAGEEVRGEWENGVRLSAEPVAVPEHLKRAHVELFSVIVNCVHRHVRGYGNGESVAAPLAFAPGSFFSPPNDVYSQSEESTFNTVDTQRGLYAGHLCTHPQGTAVPAMPQLVAPDTASVVSIPPPTVGSAVGFVEPKKLSLRDAMTRPSARDTIFISSMPMCNERFSMSRFQIRLFVFLFPFFSFPSVPFSPLRITTLEEEREFVVSGGTLGRDFDPPSVSLFIIAVGICCQVASIVIVACRVKLGKVQRGALTLPEMVIPCVLWYIIGLFCACYNAYFHVPSGLERMDRTLTPQLAGHAASVVDSRAKVCIYTWDDDGRGKVRNSHYRYRWFFIAVVLGAMLSLSAPSTRGGYGHAMYGKRGFEMAAALLAFFTTFFFATLLSYYVLKLTDMQREVRAKLSVLSSLAFIEKRSIYRPSALFNQPFELDLPLDPTDLFHGFPGWYTARSMVLYSSACANHRARSSAMSIFVVTIFFASIVALADVFKDLAEHRIHSREYYSTAHSYGLVVLFFWGTTLMRYFWACTSTVQEMDMHLSIMDTASLYHLVKLHDPDASKMIQLCRQAASQHDARPGFFQTELAPYFVILTVMLNLAGLAAIAYELGQAIYY